MTSMTGTTSNEEILQPYSKCNTAQKNLLHFWYGYNINFNSIFKGIPNYRNIKMLA
ncbi:hypothetical protein [Clostridium chromiireducens]|uniref:hypothetical protein n=1 Tax=Clostridium chromiireducens TaxID=225345 RepID=UPI001A9BDBF6|nr:hypothetical protein [Clostridium chromiireducens]